MPTAAAVFAAVAASAFTAVPAGAGTRAAARADVELTPVTQAITTPPRWFGGTDGRVHLQYELQLTNTIPLTVNVTGVEVRGDGRVIERLTGDRLAAAMAPLGSETGTGTELSGATVGVVWIDLDLPDASAVPERLSHGLRIDVGEGLPVGPVITSTGGRAAVAPHAPIVIDPPLSGGRWVALAGASGPHRRALQAVNGRVWLSQRFAVDFSALLDDGDRTHAGDPGEAMSYFVYDQDVLAVAAGTVVAAVDGLPDQVPNQHEALPTAEQDGNHVILRLADGVYAGYAHLAPGSVRVRPGDRVRAGDVIGQLGNTGASSGPHLHFQVMNRPSILAADGLPFVLSDVTIDGTITSLQDFLDADTTGTPVAIDATHTGPRRDRGIAGLEVLTFAGAARSHPSTVDADPASRH